MHHWHTSRAYIQRIDIPPTILLWPQIISSMFVSMMLPYLLWNFILVYHFRHGRPPGHHNHLAILAQTIPCLGQKRSASLMCRPSPATALDASMLIFLFVIIYNLSFGYMVLKYPFFVSYFLWMSLDCHTTYLVWWHAAALSSWPFVMWIVYIEHLCWHCNIANGL